MRNTMRLSVVLFTCIASFYVLPATAGASSASLRPVAGKSMVYESYVSNDPNDCKEVNDDTVEMSGAASVFVGANTFPSAYKKPMTLQCDKDYVMVTMTTQTTGAIGTTIIGGGAITNNGKAMCCPVKHRWASPRINT